MKLITRLQNDLPAERLLLGEPMSRHTSFRIGGAAVTLSGIDIVEQISGAEGTEISGLLGADILTGRRWAMDFRSGYFSLEG